MSISEDFIKSTPTWYKGLPEEFRDKPCFVCGIIPKNMSELALALQSQMSDLRKEVEKLKWHEDFESGLRETWIKRDEVLLLMKKESLQSCIECGEVVEEHESVKNCHNICRVELS